MSKPPAKRSALRYMRGLMIALALLLPTLSLAVFGTVWLWQNGLLLVWSIVASLTAVAIYAGERWLVARSAKRITDGVAAEADGPAAPPLPDGSPDAEVLDSYTALERRAWAAVEEISEKVDPDTLASRDAIIELGISTVEAVAQRMYPDEKDPLWRFTVPEALTLIGRVSDRLNGFVIDNVLSETSSPSPSFLRSTGGARWRRSPKRHTICGGCCDLQIRRRRLAVSCARNFPASSSRVCVQS